MEFMSTLGLSEIAVTGQHNWASTCRYAHGHLIFLKHCLADDGEWRFRRGPVFGVRWSDAETAKARVFISLSADGRLVMWSLVKDKLQHQV